MPATLFLIPVPIAENTAWERPAEDLSKLQFFVAENARTTRRQLRQWYADLDLNAVEILEIDKHEGVDLKTFKQWLDEGKSIGLMSEAGCPAVADPGADLVAIAHERGAIVKPLVGPSSILLALMGSGLGGQQFAFWGYLPVKDPARSKRIQSLEQISRKENQTQIFIETPYRNESMLNDLIKHCAPSTRICIAQNLSSKEEFLKTNTAANWKKTNFQPAKSPAVFLILAN
jgi:16S rRNA (cytidine1402-2'-O)-methyltransferase